MRRQEHKLDEIDNGQENFTKETGVGEHFQKHSRRTGQEISTLEGGVPRGVENVNLGVKDGRNGTLVFWCLSAWSCVRP